MRRWCSVARRGALLIAALACVAAAPASAQGAGEYSSFINGVTFGASHYRWFRLPSPHASLCAEACYEDRRCVAWTYQSPETHSSRTPLCYLHPRVFSQTYNQCCTSGVIYSRHAGPAPGRPYRGGESPEDYSTFREGVTLGTGDYRQVVLPSPHSSLCARHCLGDRRCVAWTYQRPESNRQNVPFCYLHPFVASVTPHYCCTSGWIRGRGARF